MKEQIDFRFAIPKPPEGPLVEITAAEAEKRLLKKLDEKPNEATDVLWQLARLYQQTGQIEKGLECLRKVLSRMPDPESKANCVLGMGQMMETASDYQAAVRYYSEGLGLEPTNSGTWYFINNNLGFSLNTLGRFAEGERYCRIALKVDPNRPNAYKNLGIALAGQGDYHAAAEAFVAATRANAADPRAMRLLQDLLKEHPELEYDFETELKACENAVGLVEKEREKLKPVVYRGWRKHLFLWWTKCRTLMKGRR
jgi:tetratricopeptide (TPR) repeat protein